MRYLYVFLLIAMVSCKKSTSYQVVLFNDTSEQLKVKVYASKNTLSKDTFVVNPSQQIELFYKEEEGLQSVYQCKGELDSVIVYSANYKMRINGANKTLWQYSENHTKYREEHKCSLGLSVGDTIK